MNLEKVGSSSGALWQRPLKFIIVTFAICYSSLLVWAYASAWAYTKPGYVGTLLKTLEDDTSYLSFLNATWAGQLLFRILEPVFGFHYGDIVVVCFMFLASVTGAGTFFLLNRLALEEDVAKGRQKRSLSLVDAFLAALVGVIWVVLSRKIREMSEFSLLNFFSPAHWYGNARSIIGADGTNFTRFYQPGLSLCMLVVGIYAIETGREAVRKVALWKPLIALAVVGFFLSKYPWFATEFLVYAGLQVLWALKTRNKGVLKLAIPAILFLLTLLLLSFSKPPAPDMVIRLPVLWNRNIHWEYIVPNSILLLLTVPFLKSRSGQLAFTIYLAQAIATLSNVMTGYSVTVQYFYMPVTLPSSLLIFTALQHALGRTDEEVTRRRAFLVFGGLGAVLSALAFGQHLNWRLNWFAEVTRWPGYIYWALSLPAATWGSLRIIQAYRNRAHLSTQAMMAQIVPAFVSLAVLVGLGQQAVIFRRDYHTVSLENYDKTRKAQESCGRSGQPQYFFSSKIDEMWSVAGRSLCKNLIYSAWRLDKSNEDIVARYVAAMLYFKVFPSRDAIVEDLEKHFAMAYHPTRELTRNHYFYSDTQRFHAHTIWYLLFIGFHDEDRIIKIRNMFKNLDLTPYTKEIADLDQAGQILVLDNRRPDLDPPGRGL